MSEEKPDKMFCYRVPYESMNGEMAKIILRDIVKLFLKLSKIGSASKVNTALDKYPKAENFINQIQKRLEEKEGYEF